MRSFQENTQSWFKTFYSLLPSRSVSLISICVGGKLQIFGAKKVKIRGRHLRLDPGLRIGRALWRMDSSASTGPAGVSGSSSEQLRRLTKHLLGPGVPPAVQVKQKWKKYMTYEEGIILDIWRCLGKRKSTTHSVYFDLNVMKSINLTDLKGPGQNP